MLATTPSAFGNLQTVRLVLSLTANDPARVPQSLLKEVQTIVAQAHDIVADAAAINKDTRPEAIALAYAMRQSKDLTSDINDLAELQCIDRNAAGSTLQHLDAAFAT